MDLISRPGPKRANVRLQMQQALKLVVRMAIRKSIGQMGRRRFMPRRSFGKRGGAANVETKPQKDQTQNKSGANLTEELTWGGWV